MTALRFLPALALLPSVAFAQSPYSVDAEFVRPAYGADSLVGVDVSTATKPRTFRLGTTVMYTRNPVTLWDRLDNREIGAVVRDRFGLMLGASFDLSDRVTLNALIPMAFQTGAVNGEPQDYEAPGFGMQDIGVGARLTAIRSKHFNLGIKAGLLFPTGRDEAYLGDTGFRPHGGLLASVHAGRTMVATDLQVMLRPDELQTNEDFTASNELNFNVGMLHKLPDATRLGFTAQVMTKAGFENFLKGGGENALEGLAGIQVYPSRTVTLDFAGGRGLTQGYATTDLRILGSLKVEFAPKEPVTIEPPPPIQPTPPDPPIIVDPIPDPPPIETEFVVVTDDNIEVKQRLEFVVGTTKLLDKSRPTLRGVADYINNSPEAWKIAHLEIVGHASAEGSYEYNYDLSQGRARTIWQELIEAGVHPDRISYKGMGEVVPRDMSKVNRELTESELQDNRRVEFHIVKTYDALEEKPFDGMSETIKAPWSGNVIRVVVPEKPEPEPEEGQGDDFDEFEDGSFDLDDIEGDEGFEIEPAPEDSP